MKPTIVESPFGASGRQVCGPPKWRNAQSRSLLGTAKIDAQKGWPCAVGAREDM
jgi:hypothetical protein